MVVDVTLARNRTSKRSGDSVHLPDLLAHQQAIRTITGALTSHHNWYLDLANEHDVRDARFVPIEELLRGLARELAPNLLVTASFGGRDLTLSDVRDAMQGFSADFLAIHRPRHAGSPAETESRVRCFIRSQFGGAMRIGSQSQTTFSPLCGEHRKEEPQVGASTTARRVTRPMEDQDGRSIFASGD